jgi:D-alanyl-lipoteichoic acid acyltransferase DltB (MBOAT superfamily)
MLFNSLPFAVFLPVVFAVYWSLRRAPLRVQNLFVLCASYFFYGWWDWRFLSLIFVSSMVDYLVGLGLSRAGKPSSRRALLTVSLATNLGLLGIFKYYDFFVTSFCELLASAGLHASPHLLSIVLPVGISFYTFQTLSYTIDVYRRNVEPTRDILAFFAFVSFFPQLVAGPIERARNLLPQFLRRREFDDSKARDGMRQMLSGFMKKMLIADNLAPMVDEIFRNYQQFDGFTLLTGVFFFAMQIYCDFSGYSDIAIGCARLFGFDLMRNFAFPYFSRDIAEFWRRWHISLSTWLRDYLYIPLCGSRPSRARKARGILVTFTLCGLWHGASWTFVFWGLLHGLYFLPLTLGRRRRRFIGDAAEGRLLPSLREFSGMLLTFVLVCLGWVFFRSQDFPHAFGYLRAMTLEPGTAVMNSAYTVSMLVICFSLLCFEWIMRKRKHVLEIGGLPVAVRWSVYLVVVTLILVGGVFSADDFIYFQF